MRSFFGSDSTWREGRWFCGLYSVEWSLFKRSFPALSLQFGGYDSNRIVFHMGLIFFNIFLSRRFSRVFRDRDYGVRFHDGSLWISLGCDDDWYRDRPWYQNTICLPVSRWIFGRERYTIEEGPWSPTLIPMPEGSYAADVRSYRQTWKWRFGYTITKSGHEFRMNPGIPFAGKGENSWDCGDDGLYGISCSGSISEGIGKVVSRVLDYRQRYGNASYVHESDTVMAKSRPSSSGESS